MARDFAADIAAIQQIDAVPRILEVICRSTGMGFAAVARVTENRWIVCAVRDEISFGLVPGGELRIETTLCHEVRQTGEPIVIDDVAQDQVYCGHPAPAIYGFQSYISIPIMLPDGSLFGTLCAIDPKPAKLTAPEAIGMFKLFAELIAFHLDAAERLASSEARLAFSRAMLTSSEADLAGERRAADLREQFIAVLGHDLRNPLASIAAGARLLLRSPPAGKAAGIVEMILNSVDRMSGLIDNVMDFASGRLGGGLTLNQSEDALLEPALSQVVAELRTAWPDRTIETEFDLDEPVSCDRGRIAQLLSNLLANALKYGAEQAPVRVRAAVGGGSFILSVANSGEPIPAASLGRLFQPFTRGKIRGKQQGLGLGLYIASEIARAHGGKIEVSSTAVETRFTFRMPVRFEMPASDAPDSAA
jgi:signal transduction histidine kinase